MISVRCVAWLVVVILVVTACARTEAADVSVSATVASPTSATTASTVEEVQPTTSAEVGSTTVLSSMRAELRVLTSEEVDAGVAELPASCGAAVEIDYGTVNVDGASLLEFSFENVEDAIVAMAGVAPSFDPRRVKTWDVVLVDTGENAAEFGFSTTARAFGFDVVGDVVALMILGGNSLGWGAVGLQWCETPAELGR